MWARLVEQKGLLWSANPGAVAWVGRAGTGKCLSPDPRSHAPSALSGRWLEAHRVLTHHVHSYQALVISRATPKLHRVC